MGRGRAQTHRTKASRVRGIQQDVELRLHKSPCKLLASTALLQKAACDSHKFSPRSRPTAILMASLLSQRLQAEIGMAKIYSL